MKKVNYIAIFTTAITAFLFVLFFTTSCKKEDKILIPTATTASITNTAQTTATCGGNVTSDGGGAITERGVCWGTEQSPTISNSKTSDGAGTGNFTSSITGLTANTPYYVRAFATNSAGTAYGNQQSFTTLQNATAPTVTTNAVTDIAQTIATSGGNVTSDGGASVTARGVCWSTSANPTITDSHTPDGAGTGSFTSSITGLTANTPYYVRAYATNSAGTAYGNQQSFTTLQNATAPTLTTNAITEITQITATSGGNVTSDGGANVTARGVCWSTSTNPTITNSHTTNGTGTGNFSSSITGLTPNTPYYVRAYATNSAGTAYGNQQSFTTLQSANLPTVTTTSVTNIAQTTATSGGNVTSDGGATVTARGVCWSTSTNPTISNSHTTNGTGTGSFTSYITGLSPNTPYYVRAYATNNAGTAYGNQVNFTTLPVFTIGMNYQGGIIFYIDGTSQHGLIASTSDQGPGFWGCWQTTIGGTSTAIGTGQANTTAIVNKCSEDGIAARICNDLVLNGYSDWFLPSRDEMHELYLQRTWVGGFNTSGFYWTSSEDDSNQAWAQLFVGLGNPTLMPKITNMKFRAIRAF